MFLTGFADEAGASLATQIKATRELGWKFIETRNLDGKNLASFVYNRDHKVSGLNGDRAVIVYNNTVVAAVKVSDLILV